MIDILYMNVSNHTLINNFKKFEQILLPFTNNFKKFEQVLLDGSN